jgi:type IV secretion system protein VirB6
MLGGLKSYVKGGVFVALTLAVILLGIKTAISGQVPETSELFSFILKFGVVLYMCIGTGLTELVYKGGSALITDLPNYLMSQISDEFCNYQSRDYGDNQKYAYVLAWDILDCRISHYLLVGVAGAIPSLASLLPFGALQIIIPLILSIQILIGILLLVFIIFILSLAANFLHMMVLAMLSLGILTYAGFIFVPMMLFSYTEGYFKKWWQGLVSCALQPVIISAFMSVTFLAFDNIMYKDCGFKPPENSDKPVWTVTASGPKENECKKRLGYQIFDLLTSKDVTGTEVGLLFHYSIIKASFNQIGELLKSLIQALFFCYLFMLIATKGGEFASQLTSGPNIGKHAVSAGALINALLAKLGTKPNKDKNSGSQASQSTGSGSTASQSTGSGSTASKAARK